MDYFEHAWRLLNLLWIVPLFGILVYYASARRKSVLKTIFGDNAGADEHTSLSTGKRLARQWLLFAAIVMLCVAAARPRWRWRLLPFSARGRDIMIVLDVSKSMLSEDISPSRLKHAKLFVRNLVEQTPGDRYGLVAFAGDAFLECPLTMDKTSFFQALDEASPDSIPLGGTNIQRALEKTLAAFKGAEGGYKAIILLTDGDELTGDSSQVVSQLKKVKTPIFVVGIGNPSGDGLIKMTGPNGKVTLLRDRAGKLVKSRLNEKDLRRLASSVPNGLYVRSTETNLGLAPLLKKVHSLVPKEYATGTAKRPIERFHYPLLVAVLLLLVRMGLGERRQTRRLAKTAAATISIIALALAGFNASAAAPTPSKAHGQPALQLAAPIKEPTGKDKKNGKPTAEQLYNKGLEFHKKKDITNATKYYRAAINASKVAPEARSKAFQNLGVIAHQQGRAVMAKNPDEALKIFDKAESMYRESMRSDVKRKHVVLNQQKLLDDREIAKKIKKRMEDLKKKQQEARRKTQQALNQQKKENQKKNQKQSQKQQQCNQRKNNNQKRKNQQKNQSKNQQDKQKNQGSKGQNKQQQKANQKQQNKKNSGGENNREKQRNKQNNQPQNKNGQKNKEQNKKQNNQKKQAKGGGSSKTREKIKAAEKAVDNYANEANSQKRKQEEANAVAAKQELDKAMKEHARGNGKKAEEHLRKALERLGGHDSKNNQNKQNGKNSDKNKQQKKNSDKRDKGDKGRKDKMDDNKPIPKPSKNRGKQENGESGKRKEKDIDPAQAAALLDLMANQEKTLRDAIREYQKRNAKVRKVLKDW